MNEITIYSKSIDNLFKKWEEKHFSNGYKYFIRDGIVNPDIWYNMDCPKICYFLKEAYTYEGKYDLPNLVKELKNKEPWSMWKKVSVWTQAIHNAFLGDISYVDENNYRENIDKIAVCNIKKSNGNSHSEEKNLEKFLNEDLDELKEEILLINPDIILCGYTFRYLMEVLKDEDIIYDYKNSPLFAIWKDKLIIDYYHPACFYPNRVNYYALSKIVQVAMKNHNILTKYKKY
ncbi:hypothetical protein [Parvimonas micra]|jgi:hypothetical protein|uniref:hypothetical protein n=2 Tax=Parvimonas micra TaxID=33033 RepID=UPI00241E6BD6|nr:hypothetical protein [Parvimonas micra]